MAGNNKTTELVTSRLDVERFYTETEGLEGWTPQGGGQFLALCPFHDDHHPSLSIGPKGLFKCFSCNAEGSVFDFYMRRHDADFKTALKVLAEHAGVLIQGTESGEPVDEMLEVIKPHEALLKNKAALKFLQTERGLSLETIVKKKLGWDGERVTIPVRDSDGILINVRKYKPHAKSLQGKVTGLTGHNKVRFFPATWAHDRPVVICEGEMDQILLEQEGFNAITVTSGAGNWPADPGAKDMFKGDDVIMSLDNDNAGRIGTDRVLREHGIATVAKTVRVLKWPDGFKEKGDVTDFLVELGGTRDQLQELYDAAPEWVAPKPDDLDQVSCTDVGNALRLITKHGDSVRYVHLWRSWMIWDNTRWRRDETQQVAKLCQDVIADLGKTADPITQPELARWALRSESSARLGSMQDIAEYQDGISMHPRDFDQQPWLLACTNGTVDLRTGVLREARREDHITKSAKAAYDPDATSADWEKVLDAVTDGDAAMREWLQMAFGYSITGSTIEEKLFFCWGPTSSGKSTTLEAIKGALGEYAVTAHFSSFLEQRNAGEAKGDIARLAGARLVCSIEVDEGKKLAEGLIKQLTGGDTITARFMYQEAFEFMLQAKLWLAANHKPRVSDEDDALWRRILLVPFDKTIKNPDPAIKAAVLDVEKSGPAILAWLVKGVLMWQAKGRLGTVPKVELATKQYRAEQNPIMDWFDECVVIDAKAEVINHALYNSYKTWCLENGVKYPITAKRLSLRLVELGYESHKGAGNKTVTRGIKLAVAGSANEPDF